MATAIAAAILLSAPLEAQTGAPVATGTSVDFTITNARSTRGYFRLCLTSNAQKFPDCRGDSTAHTLSVAATSTTAHFANVPPGTYALSMVHDENGNDRMDTRLGIPREGYGFSRDAAVRFGPPRFSAASFAVAGVPLRHSVRVRYIF